MTKFTHTEVVSRAERWLRSLAIVPDHYNRPRHVRCGVVLTERSGEHENPDAIGWLHRGRLSIVVECKATRSDFLADRDKKFRELGQHGMGRYRYFMTPRKLVSPDELPPLWGLIELSKHRSWLTRLAAEQPEYDHRSEVNLLWSELAKYQLVWNGVALWPCKAKRVIEATVAHVKEVEASRREPRIIRLKRKFYEEQPIDAEGGEDRVDARSLDR